MCGARSNDRQCEDYFKKLLSEDRQQFLDSKILDESNIIKEIDVRNEEVNKTFQTLKNNKSPGPRRIADELIKNRSEKLHRMIKVKFLRATIGETFPEEWTQGYLFSIFKKGEL